MDFKRARAKTKRIRQERTLLLVYAVAITIAFFISIYHNNNVSASVTDEEDTIVNAELEDIQEALVLQENLKSEQHLDVEDTASMEGDIQELSTADEMVSLSPKAISEDLIVVEKGDNFMGILTKLGVEYGEANTIYQAYKKIYDAKNIKIGQELLVSSASDPRYQDTVSITKIVTEPVSGTRYIIEKKSDGTYEARVEQDDLVSETQTVSGVIQGTLAGSMKNAGVPQNVVGHFINIFSFFLISIHNNPDQSYPGISKSKRLISKKIPEHQNVRIYQSSQKSRQNLLHRNV